jgi:hypothetical protein
VISFAPRPLYSGESAIVLIGLEAGRAPEPVWREISCPCWESNSGRPGRSLTLYRLCYLSTIVCPSSNAIFIKMIIQKSFLKPVFWFFFFSIGCYGLICDAVPLVWNVIVKRIWRQQFQQTPSVIFRNDWDNVRFPFELFHRLPFGDIQRYGYAACFTTIRCFELQRRKHGILPSLLHRSIYWAVSCVVPRTNYPYSNSPKKVRSSCNAFHLYSGRVRFEPRSRYWLVWLRFFVVSLNPSRQIPRENLRLGQDCFIHILHNSLLIKLS